MLGIAAILLDNGRTLHSRCKVPINVAETLSCSISPNDQQESCLKWHRFIIDEVSMGHKYIFESIDRTLQDVRNNDKPFGGLTIVFFGDWCQVLPVVRSGSRTKIVQAALKTSYLWNHVTLFQLKTHQSLQITL